MPLDFPTYRHRKEAEKVVAFFRKRPETSAVPELYHQLPGLFEMKKFESFEQETKAENLRGLLETYVTNVTPSH